MKTKDNLVNESFKNGERQSAYKEKFKTLKDLHKEINNYIVDFEIIVNEETTKNFAYSALEKYELLKSKNKAIVHLKRTFNLEL